MKLVRNLFVAALMLVTLQNCSTSANLVNSYTAPTAQTVLRNAKKIIVAALYGNESFRETAETQIAAEFNGRAVPSFTALEGVSSDQVSNYLTTNGYDVALVSRLVSTDNSLNYVPGNFDSYPPYYGQFGGYWSMAYSNFYDPGYYQTSKTYRVETNLYDLKTGKLIYSAITDSEDPSSFKDGISGIVSTVEADMKKNNLY